MLLGLTGGIASGKSTVSQLLVKHGALLVDADQVARDVVEPGQPALNEIVSFFGQAVLNDNGTLNRATLGEIVFSDKEKLQKLESITHPAIRARMKEMFERYKKEQPDAIIIADIPLLYETKQTHLYEGIIVVYIPYDVQINRLMKRNGLTEEAAISRIKLQMNLEEKARLADYIIDNSGTLDETEEQIVALLQRLGEK